MALIPVPAPIQAALQSRSAPNSYYNWFNNDFQIFTNGRPGGATVKSRVSGADGNSDASFMAYMLTRFAGQNNGNAVYVAPWGNDGNPGTLASPYLTLLKAVRQTLPTFVYLMGFGPRNPLLYNGYYSTDTAAGALKIVRGLGTKQYIGTQGTDLATATYTASGTNYTVPVNAFPTRVLYSGERDNYGKAVPLKFYNTPVTITGGGGSGAIFTAQVSAAGVVTGFTQISGGTGYTSAPTVTIGGNLATPGQAGQGSGATATANLTGNTVSSLTLVTGGTGYGSVASLTGNVWGWAYDYAGTITIRMGGANVSLAATMLRAIYAGTTLSAQGDPRLLLQGPVNICFENIVFDGCYLYGINNGATPGNVAVENCEVNYSPNYGCLWTDCNSYMKNVRIYRSFSDGINYKNTATTNAAGVEYNLTCYMAGDFDTFGCQFGNVNGSSNDSSNSTSGVVRINGEYAYCQGPTLPDHFSWNISVKAGPSGVTQENSAGVTGGDFVLDQVGAVYCDGCESGGSRYGFYAYAGPVHLSNCLGKATADAIGGSLIDSAWIPPM